MVWNLWVKIIKSYYLRKHIDYQNSIKSPEILGGGSLSLNKVFTGLSCKTIHHLASGHLLRLPSSSYLPPPTY